MKIKFAVPSKNKKIVPVPSKTTVPEWYRNAERFIGGDIKIKKGFGNHGVKLCIPFLDALTSGYTATLWTDIHVKTRGDEVEVFWEDDVAPVLQRENINSTIPVPIGCHSKQLAWRDAFHMQLPAGYSAVLTHPLNRYDLPFLTLTGIVDADYTLPRGEFPFFLKKDFSGIIPSGTPMFQILPFKRENWIFEYDESIMKVGLENEFLTMKYISGWYKKNKWKKKSYD